MTIAVSFAAATMALLSPAAAAPAVMAYFEGAPSVASLDAFAGHLQIVAADLFAINAKGRITGHIPASLTSIASTDRIQVLVTVSNFGINGFSEAIAHAILTPGMAQQAAIANMVKAAAGYAGINLDFESVRRTDRAAYTAFATALAAALHQHGLVEVLSIPAETADNPKDSWTGAFDYAALGRVADLVQVMTYDENGPWGPPGPVAGLDWMSACLAFSQRVLPAGKISLGVPAYGYDWNLTAGGGKQVAYAAVPALMTQTGAVPQWDAATSSPWFSYTAANGASHVVWYENAKSIALKSALATQHGVAGLSIYALGFENAAFWSAMTTSF